MLLVRASTSLTFSVVAEPLVEDRAPLGTFVVLIDFVHFVVLIDFNLLVDSRYLLGE